MKKTMSLLLCVLLIAALCACNDTPTETPDPTPTPDAEPVGFTKDDGKLDTETYYNPNGLKYATVIYAYDGMGRVTSEKRLGLNDAEEGILYHEYLDSGLVSQSVFKALQDDGTYTEQYRVSYTYDESELLLQVKMLEGETVKSSTVYEYDAEGRLVNEKRYEGESFCMAEYVYTYDSNGRVISCNRSDYIEESTSENNYGYDAKGRLLTDQCYDAKGNMLSRTEYAYDENGNEIKRSVYTEGGELISSTEKTYEYDDIGNIISCITVHSDGTPGTTVKYTWQYSKG